MNISIKEELQTITEFVQWCMRDADVVGFNVHVSRREGISYILAKASDLTPKYAHEAKMDWANPLERPLITDAITLGITGKHAEAQTLEAEMISRSH